jgi:hypothetical protein
MMDTTVEKLADDILRGAEQIAAYVYGHPRDRRKVYHLAETSRFPVFRLGSVLCARKSRIKDWIAEQERRGCRSPLPERKPDEPEDSEPPTSR